MKATALSNTVNTMGVTRLKVLYAKDSLMIAFPRSDMSKWPAIMFAVSRTHRVTGRIKLLTSSIRTMKFIKGTGVPWGSKCDNMCLVFFIHPNIIMVIQDISERGRVTVRWAVGEKICGYIARKLRSKIVTNISIIIISVPFSDFLNVYFTSFMKFEMILFCKVPLVDLIFHIFVVIIVIDEIIISHDSDITDVEGSNVENKFVISLNVFFVTSFL